MPVTKKSNKLKSARPSTTVIVTKTIATTPQTLFPSKLEKANHILGNTKFINRQA
jgi:hypothetical protein